ncbi:MAG: transposase [Reichenbachiella sp.]
MRRNYKIRDQDKLYFVSFATVNWIDVFVRTDYKEIVVESLRYCISEKGLEVYGWCIMTSHIHLIIGTKGENKLEDIIRDLKRHTSKSILKSIEDNNQESRREWLLWMFERAGKRNPNNKKYQFWQQNNHPIELSSNRIMQQKLDYIHANPVEAGIVREPHDYIYSSASDYAGEKGFIPILFIE